MKVLSKFCRGVVLAVGMLGFGPAVAAPLAENSCPKEPTRVVVIGDSLADGLWGSFKRTYSRCKSVEVVRLTVVSDGLAKTSSNKWLARYAKARTRLDTRVSDIVIVQIGANDITTIREGSRRESFATEAWNAAYSNRVIALTQGLRSKASKVIWFGLPVVGNSKFEQPYQAISALQSRAASRAGARFIDIHTHTKFGTGAFAMNGSFGGRLLQLRAPDKVHFTKAGYDYVAQAALRDIMAWTQERDRKASLNNVKLQ